MTVERDEGGSVRLDDLELDGLKIYQDPQMFCFGMDAVLLSDFVEAEPTRRCIDLCTGNGILPLLLYGKKKAATIDGIEINERSAGLARRSVTEQHLEEKIRIIGGDIREVEEFLPPASFHIVTCNPPYMTTQDGAYAKNPQVAAAKHEITCTIDDVAKAAAYLLPERGRFYLVHRPHRLADVIEAMRAYRLEPKQLRFVQPFADKEPNLVLIRGIKGGRPQLRIDAPLIIWETPGQYSDEVRRIYGR